MADPEMCSTERYDLDVPIKISDGFAEVNEKVRNLEEVNSPDPRGSRMHILEDNFPKKFSESDYTPCIVSFGPHYNGHHSCVQTEKMKENVLLWSLKMRKKRLVDYVHALKIWDPLYKEAYTQLESKWLQDNDDAFLRMMILDGFFLVEMLRQANEWFQDDLNHFLRNEEEPSHPAWSVSGMGINDLREHYRHDMLLLKNQHSLWVLYTIEAVNSGLNYREAGRRINKWIIRFVWSFPWAPKTPEIIFLDHILELYLFTLLPGEYKSKHTWERVKSMISCFPSNIAPPKKVEFSIILANEFMFDIPSATELHQTGFGFTTSEATTVEDISFGSRTLRLPQIYVDGLTKSMLLNIIAYEKVNRDAKEITSYTYFMTRLIRDKDDVKFLQQCGIIRSTLDCEEISKLFNSLRTEDLMGGPNGFLVQRYKLMGGKLRENFNRMSGEWQRDLWQNYLKSPWAFFSLIAAFLLFSLTAIQTVYTILGFYNS